MYASQICKELYKWIEEKEQHGEIHSIFKSSINIFSEDGKLIPVIVNDKPMSPNSIRLEKGSNFDNLNIVIGEKGIFTKDSFVSKNINILYDKSILWDKRIKLISNLDTYENIQLKLNLTKEFILNKGNKDGIFGLMQFITGDLFDSKNSSVIDRYQLFVKERLIKFVDDFTYRDIDSINTISKKIIGFGSGLTPSMDDFLSGMMIANIYMSHFLGASIENAYALNFQIVKGIENMTTLVSEEMLKYSSRGETNDDIRALMIALIGTSTKKQFNDLLARVINFGHSSGTDILCGIYIGSHILVRNHKKDNI